MPTCISAGSVIRMGRSSTEGHEALLRSSTLNCTGLHLPAPKLASASKAAIASEALFTSFSMESRCCV